MRKRILSAALALLAAAALSISAAAVTIEQVSALPPGFCIYLYESDIDLSAVPVSEITAYYDGVPMTVTGFMPASQAGVGVYYIYALDVSASMPRDVFDAAREAVLNAYDALGENEELALIAFGDEVATVLTGGESRERVVSALESLSPSDMSTDFYGAISRLVELSRLHGAGRRLGVVISDGVDDFYGGLSRGELEAKLRGGGVSVSAMCVDGTGGEIVSRFGEFARLSGGELFLFDAGNATERLYELIGRTKGCYALTLRSATNLTDGRTHAINFRLGGLPAETVEVAPTVWIEDTDAPRVLEAVYDASALTLTVTFSEPVKGADTAGAFSLAAADGGHIRLAGVSYSDSGKNPAAVLTLEAAPYEGEYTLSFSGIRDVSMEENALAGGALTLTLATGLTREENEAAPPVPYYIIAVAVLAVLAAAAVILAVAARKKKRETDSRFSRLENRPIIGQGGEAGSRIVIPKAEGIRVQMAIFDGKGKKYSVTPDIITSLFIGKHAGNDLVIEDSRVSRQHAVIEKLSGALAVLDLSSTNGTFVNGARLRPGVSQRVGAGDELTLGDTTIRIISIS